MSVSIQVPTYQVFNGMEFRPYPDVGQVVLLAGAEGSYFRKLMISMGVKGCLLSYYYLRQKLRQGQENMADILNDLKSFDFVFLDSGGFTLQQAVKQAKLDITLDAYTREYYEFGREYRHHFTVLGAVDAHSDDFSYTDMVGWFLRAPEYKIHIAPTLLATTSLSEWLKYDFYKKFDYVAFNTHNRSSKHVGELRQHILTAQRNRTRTHGYAMTKQEDLRALNFSSVDSLTWLGGQKYGSTYVFRAGKMRTYGLDYKKRIRPRLVNVCRKYNIDFEAIKKDDYKEVNKLNLVAWMELDQHQRVAGKRRAYWLRRKGVIMGKKGKIISEATTGDELLAEFEAEKHDKMLPAEDAGPDIEAALPPDVEEEWPEPVMAPDSEEEGAMVAPSDIAFERPIMHPLVEAEAGPPKAPVRGDLSRNLPLQCNTCLISDRCPKSTPNSACRIQFADVFSMQKKAEETLPESATNIIKLQYERIMRSSVFERADGGALDPQLSNEISRYFSMLHGLKKLGEQQQDGFTIHATGNAAAAAASGQGGGVLQNLLRGMMTK